LIDLSLFVGTTLLTILRHLSFALDCLYKTVISIKEKILQPLSNIYLKDISEKMGRIYSNLLCGCVMVIDESIYTLEKDATANSNFFY
jgi:hypothetical protein